MAYRQQNKCCIFNKVIDNFMLLVFGENISNIPEYGLMSLQNNNEDIM